MTRTKSILLGILLIMVVSVNIFLQSSSWRMSIEEFINQQLQKDTGWTVNIPVLEGNLLGKVVGKGMRFTHNNGSVVLFGDFGIKVNYIKSIFSIPTLSSLSVQNIIISPVINTDSLEIETDLDSVDVPSNLQFVIDRLKIGGRVELPFEKATHFVDLKLDSRLNFRPDQREFFISELSATVNDTDGYGLLRNTTLSILETSAHFSNANGTINGLPFEGEFNYDWTIQPDLSGNIHIERYEFPKEIFDKLPLDAKMSSIETFVHFESDLIQYNGDITINNPLGLFMKGEVSITNHDGYISLNRLGLDSDETNLSISGLYEDNGRISGNILLTEFDLSKWVTDQEPSNVNGTIMIEGSIKNNNIDDISATIEVSESELYGDRNISVSGTFTFNDKILDIKTPLTIAVGPSVVELKGFVDLNDRQTEMDLVLKDASIFLVNNFWSDSLNSGYATGNLIIKGDINNPSIKAELECTDLAYHDTHVDYIKMNAYWKPMNNRGEGFFRGQVAEGVWRDYSFDNGVVDIEFSSEGINIQSAEFKESDNYLQISGILSLDSVLTLDRMQLAYEDHIFINSKPFSMKLDPNKVEIFPFEIHVDDGIASGYMTITDEIRGTFHLSNVNADIMKIFTDDIRYHVEGMSFGTISISDLEEGVELLLDLTLKNGVAAQQKFSEMKLQGSLYNKLLSVNEVSLVEDDVRRISVSGSVPIGKMESGIREFDFNVLFEELDLSVLTQFDPPSVNWEGKISGEYFLGGNTVQTQNNFNLKINDAIYGLIPLGEVKIEGLFDGKRLYFNEFSSNYKGSFINGSAYLPIDYNLGSENYQKYFQGDSIWVNVNGNLNNMEFLTAYVSNVDSIVGDIDIHLEVIGPRDGLNRNGHFNASNVTIYSTELDEPIYNVNTSTELISNLWTWNSFKGSMVKDPADAKDQNVSMSGTMDMTRFFNPIYDISIKGDELHYRTLLGDIDGIVNVDLSLSGRDTIDIEGTIEPVDAVMYQEFSTDSDVEEVTNENETIYNYKLNFPITGDFALRNSQFDAYLSGELSMTKYGNRPADYGGELYVTDGKFYYYGDVFTINDGYMVLDKKGFNPYLDISGQTKINQEQIYVQLVGRLDNPQLVLESSSGFSDSDIIELLTIRSRFEDQEISATGFGNSAQNILGAYLERQLEKNILQFTGLDQTGLIDNVSISGTAGLIDPTNNEEFSINAERQLSQNLSLNYSYQRSFSLSNPTNNKVGVELKLNRYVSLVGNVDETGNMHVKYRLRYSY